MELSASHPSVSSVSKLPEHISNVVFFVGGGADKTRERFGIFKWGPTHLMADAKRAFEEQQGPYSATEYFAYFEKKAIVKRVEKYRKHFPNIRINLVGHSRGGSVVKDIASKAMRKRNIEANLVVSLDPVKARLHHKYKVPSKKGLKNINEFVTVYAKPKWRQPADYVALYGGQYGYRLQQRAHVFVKSRASHGQPIPLLQTVIPGSDSCAFDLLLRESNTP